MTTSRAADTGSDWFWTTIAGARGDRTRLRDALVSLPREDLRRFQEEFIDLAGALTLPPFAALVEESEDGLVDVAEWVVSQGKDLYLAVLADPTLIPHSVEGRGREILSSVAPTVYEERFGEPLDV